MENQIDNWRNRIQIFITIFTGYFSAASDFFRLLFWGIQRSFKFSVGRREKEID